MTRLSGVLLLGTRASDPAGRPVDSGRLTTLRVRRSVEQILNENILCSMATVGSRLRPHINIAYFSFSTALEVFFLSDPASAHCRNLARQPWMSIAVHSTRQEWGGRDRGLQLTGTCRPARGSLGDVARRHYGRRFPRYRRFVADATGTPFARYRLYRFVPSLLKVLDERHLGDGTFVTASVRLASRRLASGHH